MSSLDLSNVLSKKQCPYMEKCYRQNPIHFNEMSHPHLEKIIANQLEGEIKIPEKLNFDCTDRLRLRNQLKVLQMVLRKEKNRNEGSSLDEKINSANESSNQKSNEDAKTLIQVRQELDNIKIVEKSTEKDFSEDRKRGNNGFADCETETKKSKSNDNKRQEKVHESTQSTSKSVESVQSSSSTKGASLIETFESCNSAKSRNEVREQAIRKLRQQGFEVSVVEPGNFALKYALSAPYHFFFSRIEKSKPTYDQQYSITFPEILDTSLGEIVCSFHINFMVDVGWLCLQYLLAGQRTDMTILYGERVDEEKLSLNITMLPVQMPTKFGCHHSKLMILRYKDEGIRVVVSTANLYMDDWENRTQGVWISPHLPPLPESANSNDGESQTYFKRDLQRYLHKYRQPAITEWISAVRRADFSSVNVFFLASVPGRHTGMENDYWGHKRLSSILSQYAKLPPDAPQWTLVAQSSSIGSLGANYEDWLQQNITSSMSKENPRSLKSQPHFQFIYPSLKNYKESFDCQVGSCCLPYSLQTHSKQEWIESHMYQWKAARTARDRAMPHIKTYTRISPDLKKIPWFVLTSANLSKAAWGKVGKDQSHYIMNYEAGVVFIPQLIVQSTTFPIQEEEAGIPVFPIPYDLPLTRYRSDDKPFVTEFFSSE
ncbi:tyrosyl-DNA phosphodiesterase glaikit [Xylocopa sonorina]|uniref:tyrosyl-DNA phosphodiesterase glaikit n=1 Tax=Xylocopa sonorina TaxID=1818115 RepID=UPI00403B0041